MTSYIFTTLGSVTFWVLYFILSSIVVTILLRSLAESSYKHIIGGMSFSDPDRIIDIYITIIFYLLWPIILAGYIISTSVRLMYKSLELYIWPLFVRWISFLDKITSTVIFNRRTKEND